MGVFTHAAAALGLRRNGSFAREGGSRRGRSRHGEGSLRGDEPSVGKDSSTSSALFDLELSQRASRSVRLGASVHADGSTHAPGDPSHRLPSGLLQRIIYLSRPVMEFELDLLQDLRALRTTCCRTPDGQLDLPSLVGQLQELGYACYLKRNNPADPGHRHNVQPACLEKLSHEFVMCAGRADGSLAHWCLVDPRFRDQFAIAQPTPTYDRCLKALPLEFVGTPLRLRALVEVVCAQMAEAFASTQRTLPPWRRLGSTLSKWFDPEDMPGTQAAAAAPPPLAAAQAAAQQQPPPPLSPFEQPAARGGGAAAEAANRQSLLQLQAAAALAERQSSGGGSQSFYDTLAMHQQSMRLQQQAAQQAAHGRGASPRHPKQQPGPPPPQQQQQVQQAQQAQQQAQQAQLQQPQHGACSSSDSSAEAVAYLEAAWEVADVAGEPPAALWAPEGGPGGELHGEGSWSDLSTILETGSGGSSPAAATLLASANCALGSSGGSRRSPGAAPPPFALHQHCGAAARPHSTQASPGGSGGAGAGPSAPPRPPASAAPRPGCSACSASSSEAGEPCEADKAAAGAGTGTGRKKAVSLLAKSLRSVGQRLTPNSLLPVNTVRRLGPAGAGAAPPTRACRTAGGEGSNEGSRRGRQVQPFPYPQP